MSKSVLVIGATGSGKSSSVRNLSPDKTIIFSVLGKGLPIPKARAMYKIWNKETCPEGHLILTSSSKAIVQWLRYINEKMPQITTIIIDDSSFISAKALDKKREEAGYQKFSDIAHDFLELSEVANTLRDDIIVYFLNHIKEEGDDILVDRTIRALGAGKMIDEKLGTIEAHYEIVLMACKLADNNNNISYKFKTRDKGSSVKTPMDLFTDEYIDNDLQAINERINCYYSGDCNETEQPVVANLK